MQNKQEFLYKGPNHAANLNDMRLKVKYCDVTIKIDGKEIRAHKVVLAANLKYFETMFSSDSFQESHGGVITMKSVEEADLELFVSYAYTGEILLTDNNALNLLELANYLSEDGIKEACVEFLKKHLKVEEACRAYKFANRIDCLSLKNAAKTKILTNFRECSKSSDYLHFDPENLMDILSDGKVQSIQLQKMFFEGILKWIVFEAKDRKSCMQDLLNSIDITKLKADEVMNCLHKNVACLADECGITKDTVVYYQVSITERKEKNQALMIVSSVDSKTCFHFYNLEEKKWSSKGEILDTAGDIHPSSAVLNDKLYYVRINSEMNLLQLFDPSSKQVATLHLPSPILTYATVCACSKFLYICGGTNKGGSKSDQLLRYDPHTNSFETLNPMGTKRSSTAAIFYQDFLYVLGGCDGSNVLQTVEKFDPVRNEWTTLASMCKERRGQSVAILDEKLYVCGGYPSKNSVEVYDLETNSWRLVCNMNQPRDYSQAIVHEGRLLVFGGGQKTVEVYDPSKDQWQIDDVMSSGLQAYHCVGGLIPSSCITDT